MWPLLFIFGGLGLAALTATRRDKAALSSAARDVAATAAAAVTSAGEAAASALTLETPVSGHAWTMSEGVRLSPALESWLDRLAAYVAPVRVHVTSGQRTPGEQAAAMLKKAQRADAAQAAGQAPADSDDLVKLYADDEAVQTLLDSGRDLATWTSIIAGFVAEGRLFSRHLREPPDAVDLRIRDLSDAEQATLKAGVLALGAEAVPESDHMHAENIPGAA